MAGKPTDIAVSGFFHVYTDFDPAINLLTDANGPYSADDVALNQRKGCRAIIILDGTDGETLDVILTGGQAKSIPVTNLGSGLITPVNLPLLISITAIAASTTIGKLMVIW